MDKVYVTVKKAQRVFDCHSSQIYLWFKDGTLNSELVGTGRCIIMDAKYEALKRQRGVSHE